MINEVLSNPIFIREKYDHDKYCNGEGEIVFIDRFTRRVDYQDCRFCQRIEAYRQKQLTKQFEHNHGD